MEPPQVLLTKGLRYNLFLSHIWSTGQDQVAVIKGYLRMTLPGIAVFLDVDDLEDIGNLEKYVRQTGVMLFFLSKKYFISKNCLKEIRASIEMEKPIVLVHESNELHGGAPLEALVAECPTEMRPSIFDGRTPIAWHRISHYQRLTIKLIATEAGLTRETTLGRRGTTSKSRGWKRAKLLNKSTITESVEKNVEKSATTEKSATAVGKTATPPSSAGTPPGTAGAEEPTHTRVSAGEEGPSSSVPSATTPEEGLTHTPVCACEAPATDEYQTRELFRA